MNTDLTAEEIRIIGCLMEKAVTTPDQYPLTLNALTNACNQKSSRHPVMSLDQGEVQRICRQLKDKHLLRIEENFKKNIEKYDQKFCNSPLGKNQFNPPEYAIICLLLLRGPQTPGEIRSRSGRLHSFDSNDQVVESLEALMATDRGPVVARLPRQVGRKDHEYMHLFSGDIDSVERDLVIASSAPSSNNDRHNERFNTLEARVAVLEKALTELAKRLGEDIDWQQLEQDLSQVNEGDVEGEHEHE